MTAHRTHIFPPNNALAGACIGSSMASDFRLAKKPNGDIVLMGCFEWSGYDNEGYACGGFEWRELPMLELDKE